MQADQNTTVDGKEDPIIMQGDNLPIVDINKNHNEGKESRYIQINHIEGKLTESKKLTEDNI